MRAVGQIFLILAVIGIWMIWQIVRRASAGVQAVISPERYAIHKVEQMHQRMLDYSVLSDRETSTGINNGGSRLNERDALRWDALVRYDPEISAAAEKLRPYGDTWIARLGYDFFALEEERTYLPNIVNRLIDEAKSDAEQERLRAWERSFLQTATGERCTGQSLKILREAEAQGYTLGVEKDKTFTATKNGTSYLRSNSDIQNFGRFRARPQEAVISFSDPMSFPTGTTLYETKGPRVAVLPDFSLIVDGGTPHLFWSVTEYRDRTGDRELWNKIRDF
jgi:hypothetical protein